MKMNEYNRVYNFSAGPSMLPVEVLEKVQKDLLNYEGSGQSVMEMSHRSKEFKKIIEDAEADLRELMNIPDNYKVMFLQGGGTLQFAMVPLNLLRKSRNAYYVITGTWAKKAYKEACKFGDIKAAASSEEDTFTWVPKITKEDIRPDADYVYITTNNTIYGTRYNYVPETGDIPLVADMSSNILSEEVDVSKFGIIWAGAQKNVGPAGVAIVIVREDLIGYAPADHIPTYLDYKIQSENGSMYNTPPCFSIYVAGEVFKYLKKIGGVKEMERRNREKAAMLYDYIDGSSLPLTFYQPNYQGRMQEAPADYRRTLYWNPNLTTDADGNCKVSFYNNGRSSHLGISVAGITTDRRMMYEAKTTNN